MKLVIVLGLSASGKSTFVREKANKLNCDDGMMLTDITLNDTKHQQRVKEWLQKHGCAVMDSACVNPTYGGKLEDFESEIRQSFPGIEIEKYYFENDPLQCIKNALADSSRGDCGMLARVKQICRDYEGYRIPNGARKMPVYKPGQQGHIG